MHSNKIASKSRRFFSFVIDSVIIQFAYFLYFYFVKGLTLFDYFDVELDLADTLYPILFSTIYGALVYPIFSGNLGHKITGIYVFDDVEKKQFNKFYEGAAREFLKSICTILIIPHLWILFNSKNQNIYDAFFKTIVLKR